MDVASGIVHQLTEVSQHTTSASNAMRHMVAEIAQLKNLIASDVTAVAEVFATIGSRSGSPGVVDYWTGKSASTDQALRKLQEKDPEFPKYDDKPEHFLSWFVSVEERKELRKISDQVAIIFATEALGGHSRGTVGDGKRCKDWREF